MQIWPRNTETERSSVNHIVDMINIVMFTIENYSISRDDHIYYMIRVLPFGLSVPRPYLHMLGSSSLTRVFCVCKTGLHPLYVNVELITPDHHVVSRHDEL